MRWLFDTCAWGHRVSFLPQNPGKKLPTCNSLRMKNCSQQQNDNTNTNKNNHRPNVLILIERWKFMGIAKSGTFLCFPLPQQTNKQTNKQNTQSFTESYATRQSRVLFTKTNNSKISHFQGILSPIQCLCSSGHFPKFPPAFNEVRNFPPQQ